MVLQRWKPPSRPSFQCLPQPNPTQIIPVEPIIDFETPHNCDLLVAGDRIPLSVVSKK